MPIDPDRPLLPEAAAGPVGARLRGLGVLVARGTHLPDEPAALDAALGDTTDLVVVIGATGRGVADHLRGAITRVGGTVIVDGVDVRPGGSVLAATLPGADTAGAGRESARRGGGCRAARAGRRRRAHRRRAGRAGAHRRRRFRCCRPLADRPRRARRCRRLARGPARADRPPGRARRTVRPRTHPSGRRRRCPGRATVGPSHIPPTRGEKSVTGRQSTASAAAIPRPYFCV
ncbi:molybdopterin-binding protein [Tsukamurella soli]|uniref:molybdopterin-binding protein n=1 Tax=Tsukamurella soli TaxID=644556 RepID=UPI0036063BF3